MLGRQGDMEGVVSRLDGKDRAPDKTIRQLQ